MKTDLSDIELFLFDMDGTLVNTEPFHLMAMKNVLSSKGLAIDLTSQVEHFAGMTDQLVLKELYPDMYDDEIKAIIEAKNQQLVAEFSHFSPSHLSQYLAPGILPFLKSIKSLNKKMAVVSASEDIVVDATLKAFELTNFFEFWLGRNQTERTKPHPDPYLLAMHRTKKGPEVTVIFEDSVNGMKAAKDSGAHAILVSPFVAQNGHKSFDVFSL
ncbi:MAG: hypothetical protein COW00_13820 [Bdellovibrio sp. CG12_big_fil_rev_8_21_14_0_65_39_13]|nr:MAG: hypothetical protein COW78_07245 [Bdellovibrio sp. CG22_combo_CG10-13_8_21_14_all_39_27]PIQ58691.1 MAG: hypothetical protein COW00_13820 [Bdellovibrio sp. CG12_big_fil_rev_8_21_14_0_65_39_13]PIR33066.1 MAG: hypothetical protein COV37_18415 [Bdellovibrio sp. CG11_big_fil_rev_8_21_14_0_20_39_38]PJB54364.1 MAG: hypothetical protein CO099_01995 [Bdellovibrio sp. CG_4_9_14_3_um_filter_39_7]